jgi:hypothetical protein
VAEGSEVGEDGSGPAAVTAGELLGLLDAACARGDISEASPLRVALPLGDGRWAGRPARLMGGPVRPGRQVGLLDGGRHTGVVLWADPEGDRDALVPCAWPAEGGEPR